MMPVCRRLLAKQSDGTIVPFFGEQERHIDGSITADLPLERLVSMFQVNQFIVSQVYRALVHSQS